MPTDKLFISADNLLDDAFRLGERVIASGFAPDILVALWRGGTPVAIAIQELLAYAGVEHRHFVVKSKHYAGIDHRHDDVLIEDMEGLLAALAGESKVLLVDDVFDTGLTLNKLVSLLEPYLDNADQLRIAAPYYKPGNNVTGRVPDYYLHETSQWVVFPHEIVGLGLEEILEGKGFLNSLPGIVRKRDSG